MHARTTERSAAMAVALIVASCCAPAPAQQPNPFDEGQPRKPAFELPRMRDRARPPTVVEFSQSMLSIGPDGSIGIVSPDERPPSVAEVRALVAEGTGEIRAGDSGVLVMSDGQRIPGGIGLVGDAAAWSSPWCAAIPMDTAGIQAVVFAGAGMPMAADEDVVELRNGDRVLGIVTAIGAKKLSIERGSGADRTVAEIDMPAISAFRLAGPAKERSGVRIWLADGMVIDAPQAEWIDTGYLRLPGIAGAKLPAMTVPRRLVAAVQSSPRSVAPLAAMQPSVAAPKGMEGVRESTPAPAALAGTWALDAPPVEVEGPAVLRYPAPAAASRLVMVVQRPATARNAGSPDLVVRAGGKELLRERLGPDRERLEVRVDLPAEPFEIELSNADGSLAGAFAVLERAVVVPR